jgi:hypothetical protein
MNFLAETLHQPYKQVTLGAFRDIGPAGLTANGEEERPMSEMSGWQLSGDAPTAYTRFALKIMEPCNGSV